MADAEKIATADAGGGAVAVRGDDGHGVRAGAVDRGAVSETAAILSLIERAARDPNVDVDKMERLFAMQQQSAERRAKVAFDTAFATMQAELPEIDKRGKIVIKEKGTEKVIQSTPYALWDDTNRLIKPILTEHGFALSFRIAQTPERITTTAVLSHCEGHREETGFSAPIDSTGSKNNVQGWGSSMAYGKRYAATALLNITTRGEDDDGKAAGADPTINDDQAIEIRDLIEATGTDEAAFCKYLGTEKLSALPAKDFDRAMMALKKKAAKR